MKVVAQTRRGVSHCGVALRSGVTFGKEVRSAVDVRDERFRVQLGDRLLLRRVFNHHEMPALTIPARRRLKRYVDAFLHQRPRHGTIKIQPLPHGPRRGQQLIGIQWKQCHQHCLIGCDLM